MNNRYTNIFLFSFLIFGLFTLSCSKKNYVQRGDSLPVAYEKSMNQFHSGDYSEAIRGFEIVFQLGRGTEYARDAQYYMAESYFRNESYLLAASEFERYSSLYPRSERREEVDFKDAFCYYKLSPKYRLDQKHTRRAIEKFNLFESRYPNSEYVPEIAEYKNELRSKLARKLYNAAQLYMRTDQYEAAAIYYGLTIDQYPGSRWAEVALADQIVAYVTYADNSIQARQRERYVKAIESYEKYLQLYPEGEHRPEAEEFADRARVALARLENAGEEDSGESFTSTSQQR